MLYEYCGAKEVYSLQQKLYRIRMGFVGKKIIDGYILYTRKSISIRNQNA